MGIKTYPFAVCPEGGEELNIEVSMGNMQQHQSKDKVN